MFGDHYVPSEIFREILTRVPLEPRLRFRRVCKEWQLTIDDPSFCSDRRKRRPRLLKNYYNVDDEQPYMTISQHSLQQVSNSDVDDDDHGSCMTTSTSTVMLPDVFLVRYSSNSSSICPPVKPLIQFTRVCKEWQLMMNDPGFEYHAQKRRRHEMLLFKTFQTVTQPYMAISLNSLDYTPSHDHDYRSYGMTTTEAMNVMVPGVPHFITVIGCSCLGLFLVGDIGYYFIALWKPLTGQIYELNLPQTRPEIITGGVGYVSGGNFEYKVVLFTRPRNPLHRNCPINTLIYSLKSRSWRVITNYPDPYSGLRDKSSSSGVFLNGTLYWITDDYILALDLRTETFRKLLIQCPPLNTHLNACGGKLFLIRAYTGDPDGSRRLNLWVLNDCPEEEKNWAKLMLSVRCDDYLFYGTVKNNPKLIAYFESKNQVVFHYQATNLFLWFDVKDNKMVKKVFVKGFEHDMLRTCQVFTCTAVEVWHWNGKSERSDEEESERSNDYMLKLELETTYC